MGVLLEADDPPDDDTPLLLDDDPPDDDPLTMIPLTMIPHGDQYGEDRGEDHDGGRRDDQHNHMAIDMEPAPPSEQQQAGGLLDMEPLSEQLDMAPLSEQQAGGLLVPASMARAGASMVQRGNTTALTSVHALLVTTAQERASQGEFLASHLASQEALLAGLGGVRRGSTATGTRSDEEDLSDEGEHGRGTTCCAERRSAGSASGERSSSRFKRGQQQHNQHSDSFGTLSRGDLLVRRSVLASNRARTYSGYDAVVERGSSSRRSDRRRHGDLRGGLAAQSGQHSYGGGVDRFGGGGAHTMCADGFGGGNSSRGFFTRSRGEGDLPHRRDLRRGGSGSILKSPRDPPAPRDPPGEQKVVDMPSWNDSWSERDRSSYSRPKAQTEILESDFSQTYGGFLQPLRLPGGRRPRPKGITMPRSTSKGYEQLRDRTISGMNS